MMGKDMAVILKEAEVGLGEAVEAISPATTVVEGAEATEEEREEEEALVEDPEQPQNETGIGFALIQVVAM